MDSRRLPSGRGERVGDGVVGMELLFTPCYALLRPVTPFYAFVRPVTPFTLLCYAFLHLFYAFSTPSTSYYLGEISVKKCDFFSSIHDLAGVN